MPGTDIVETVYESLNDKVTRRKIMERFLLELKKQDKLLTDFDPLLLRSLVSHIIVNNYNDIRIIFKNITEFDL